MLERTPPPWFRKLEVTLLMRAFAKAFAVSPPSLKGMSAQRALWTYREFTAACMEMALENPRTSAVLRDRLHTEARNLGHKVRAVVPLRGEDRFRLLRFLYRGIEIELTGGLPGDVRFGPCSFARRYTPADCWFMSAFDEGFMCGIMGIEGVLCFDCRLTEGAACCHAHLINK